MQVLDDPRQRFLHEVVGLERAPGSARQPAVSPPLEPGNIAGA